MRVHPTALKHGVSETDASLVAAWPHWIEPLEDDDWPHRELRLGFDSAGRLLEVVVLTFKNDDELVIHAMPARKQYRRLLPWQ